MSDAKDAARIGDLVSEARLLELERALIRIPSSAFEEQEIADYLANYLAEIGLEVEMMPVENPRRAGEFSRQPIGRLKGTGGGPSLMLNGHMDPGVEMPGWSVDPYGAKFEDGWIWGMGAHDDKGGIAAMVSAAEAIVGSGRRLKGDLLVCPVVAHKYGGAGTRALVAAGVLADMCINLEHSANTIANVCVGIVMALIRTRTPDLFFRYSAEAKAGYFNAVEQQAEIIRRLGPSLDPIPAGGWMRFTAHPDLPGFPMHCIDSIHKEHYYHKNYTGLSTRECDLLLQFRTVPGQTLESVKADLTALLEGIRAERPAFDYELSIPAPGTETGWFQAPMQVAKDHPMVTSLAEGHRLASGEAPHVGGIGRLGNVGDGNIMAAAGVPSLQYGPGDIRIYKEWPTPDERVQLKDLTIAAKAIAHAACRLCA
jgi:acetylornithine deacetylase/succinyl-diaminopimelate desuccinylase-like protein